VEIRLLRLLHRKVRESFKIREQAKRPRGQSPRHYGRFFGIARGLFDRRDESGAVKSRERR
jgi:hypothetical protein